ncbi:MFS transporter [Nocardia terpenica]|uniref:MFS transporter n=1 Tax=Nocardia terpenica TaxID=455432 RepID=UPI001895B062|nr:MFS transporter [Nocardia terpenica]MBF6064415.1 MFS transporter [Nocardia terpenica]MBF6106961.1 MFS transporter [Nocardia terpenica]MBF6114383.1 MFS transporter [Nocardia terpenica]MBF6121531.1 MFS transporter [Nocardia terpenica]MBF6153946.1 MFS transporter [Nocardia terpenica]
MSAPITLESPPAPRTTAAFWTTAAALLTLIAGTEIPTPLYVLYRARFGLSNAMLTTVFAIYALALIPTLLIGGRLADRFGRRRLIIGGLLAAAAGSLLLSAADSTTWLLAGRAIQGVAVGAATGAATAALVELDGPHRRAAAVATSAVAGGGAAGPLLSGLLAQYAPAPRTLSYLIETALLLTLAATLPATGTWPSPTSPSAKPLPHPSQSRLSASSRFRSSASSRSRSFASSQSRSFASSRSRPSTSSWSRLSTSSWSRRAFGRDHTQHASSRPSTRPPFGIPADIRIPFARIGITVGTAWSVGALYTSVVPSYAVGLLHTRNLAVLGAVAFVMLATAAASQLVLRSVPSRSAQSVGLGLLTVGLVALVVAFPTGSALWLVGSAVLDGLGLGLAFLGAQAELNRIAPPRHRAELAAAFNVCLYCGVAFPVVGVGLLADGTSLFAAVTAFAAGIGALATLTAVWTRTATIP